MVVYNVSDPTHPLCVGRFLCHAGAKIAVSGRYAYVNDYTNLVIVDIGNPANPVEVGRMDSPGYPLGIAVSGNYLYVADDYYGLRVINVMNPANPQEVGFYFTEGRAQSVFVVGDLAYVSAGQEYGIYDCSHAAGIIDRLTESTPQQLSLEPNYPNPFNSSTTIKYSIAKTSKVDLKVFDVTGREVAKLVDFHQNPGTYSFRFDGTSLATGTYFVRLQADDFSQTRKIVLMK